MIKDEVMDIYYKYDVTTRKYTVWINKCEFIMLHHTAWVSSLKSMTDYLSNNKAQVSVHYIIDQKWEISRIWMDNYILWHSGKWSKMPEYKDKMNNYAIGIEVISDWKTFTKEQIDYLYKLVKELQKKHNIPNDKVIRHKDYSETKIDIWDNFYKVVWYNSFEEWKEWKKTDLRKSIKEELSKIKNSISIIEELINDLKL